MSFRFWLIIVWIKFSYAVCDHAYSILKYVGVCAAVWHMAPETEKLNMVLMVSCILVTPDIIKFYWNYFRRKPEKESGDWLNQSGDWLNKVVKCLWPTARSHLTDLCKSADDVHGYKITEVHLGSTPPRFNVVNVYTCSKDHFAMDIHVKYDGDCKIWLRGNLFNIGVEGIQVNGKMKVIVGPFMKKMPMVGSLEVCFVEEPSIDCTFTGFIGKMANIRFIKNRIFSNLAQHIKTAVVHPNYYCLPLSSDATSAGTGESSGDCGGWSLLGWINLLLFFCLLGAGGTCLYVYTDGDLSQEGVSAALPRIADNANTLAVLALEALKPENLQQTAQTVSSTISEAASYLWAQLQEHTTDLNIYVEPAVEAVSAAWTWLREHVIWSYNWIADNVDWNSIVQAIRETMLFFYEQRLVICEELSKTLMSFAETIKPYYELVLEQLGTLWEQVVIAVTYIQEHCTGILESVKGHAAAVKVY